MLIYTILNTMYIQYNLLDNTPIKMDHELGGLVFLLLGLFNTFVNANLNSKGLVEKKNGHEEVIKNERDA